MYSLYTIPQAPCSRPIAVNCQTAHHLPHRSPGLTKLNLAGLAGLTERGVAYISFLPALEQLCLARCKHVRRTRMEIEIELLLMLTFCLLYSGDSHRRRVLRISVFTCVALPTKPKMRYGLQRQILLKPGFGQNQPLQIPLGLSTLCAL